MRVIDATIQMRKSHYITLRHSERYKAILKNKTVYEGKLRSFCIDGNKLVYVVIEEDNKDRLLIYGEDIEDIEKGAFHG